MELSRFVKVYPYKDMKDHVLLFSTLTSSKILIEKKMFNQIIQNDLSDSDAKTLSELGIIVDNAEKEIVLFDKIVDNLNFTNELLGLTVLLNLDCNFSCFYCFEKGIKGHFYMSEKTANDLVKFIDNKMTGNIKRLVIDFYGGEPLLSFELIKSIAKRIKSIAEKKGISYFFSLVSNGSLLTENRVKELAKIGLKHVKVTIDGPKEIHDKYRPFKSGAGSFDTIIKNIKKSCNIIKISIGGNFDAENYEKYLLLLDYLEQEGLDCKKISSVKFDPIINIFSKEKTLTSHYKKGCMPVDEPWLQKASIILRKAILERGYYVPKMMLTACTIENINSFVINYNGVIYKCPGFVGQKGYEAGDLQSGLKECSFYKTGHWKNFECRKCEYLPLCLGGCRYMSYIKYNKLDVLDCKKSYFDSCLEELIKQDIKYLSKN